MIGEEGHGTCGVGDVKVGQAAELTILQNGSELHRLYQGRQHEVPDVETIFHERCGCPASDVAMPRRLGIRSRLGSLLDWIR